MSHEQTITPEVVSQEKRPSIFKLSFSKREPESSLDFMWWLKVYVYRKKPDTISRYYGRRTNTLVISPEQVDLLQKNFEFFCFPYVGVKSGVPAEELGQTISALEKVAEEYYTSFSLDYKLSLMRVDHPESFRPFQDSLLKRIGVYDWVKTEDPDDEVLANYVATFCTDPKSVAILASNVMESRDTERSVRQSLSRALPDD